MKTILACLLTLAAAVAVAQTKISVTLDHADAMYNCNEQAVFTVTVMNGDQLHKAMEMIQAEGRGKPPSASATMD